MDISNKCLKEKWFLCRSAKWENHFYWKKWEGFSTGIFFRVYVF